MIVRLWTTRVTPGHLNDYLTFARSRSQTMFLAQPGCLGVLFLRNADETHTACSFWRSASDIAALEHSFLYVQTAQALADSGCLAGEAHTIVFDVEGGALRAAAISEGLGGFV